MNHARARGSLSHNSISRCIRDLQTMIQIKYFQGMYENFWTPVRNIGRHA